MYVCSTKVEGPSDVVQSRHQDAISMMFTQSLADTLDFIVHSLACEIKRLNLHRILRDSRAIHPNLFQGIEVGAHSDPPSLSQVRNQSHRVIV